VVLSRAFAVGVARDSLDTGNVVFYLMRNFYATATVIVVGALSLFLQSPMAYAADDLVGNPPTTDPNNATFDFYLIGTDNTALSYADVFTTSALSGLLTPVGPCDVSNDATYPFSDCDWRLVSSVGFIGFLTDTGNLNGHGADALYYATANPTDGVQQYAGCSSVGVCATDFGLEYNRSYVGPYYVRAGLLAGAEYPLGNSQNQLPQVLPEWLVNQNIGTTSSYVNSNVGSSSLPTVTNFLSFLNVANLLQTKKPFAYIFQVSSLIYLGVSSTTLASTIPSGSFDVEFPGGGTSTTTLHIDMFSTTTISYFLTPSIVSLIKLLMIAVTYFSTGWFLLHDIKRRKLF